MFVLSTNLCAQMVSTIRTSGQGRIALLVSLGLSALFIVLTLAIEANALSDWDTPARAFLGIFYFISIPFGYAFCIGCAFYDLFFCATDAEA